MVDHSPGTRPKGALPMLDACRRFLPDHLWREYERAVDAWSRYPARTMRHLPTFVHFLGAPDLNRPQAHTAKVAVERARHAIKRWLVGRLIAGEFTAIVQSDAPFGEWRPILAEDWRRRLRIQNVRKGHVTGPNIDLNDVHVIEGDHTPLLELMKTGAQGAPTSRHLVLIELDRWIVSGELARWIDSGEVDHTLKAVAKHLIEWLEQTYSKAPPLTQTSMENVIRSKFNEFKKDRKGR